MSTTRRNNDAGLLFLNLAVTVLVWGGLIFLIRQAVKHGYPPIKRFYTHPDRGVRRRRRRATALCLTAVGAPLGIASLVSGNDGGAEFAAFCTAAAASWWYGEQRVLRRQANAAIAARADQQHNWVMQGDNRGTYGPQGADLMRFIEAPPRAAAPSESPAARWRTRTSATLFAS